MATVSFETQIVPAGQAQTALELNSSNPFGGFAGLSGDFNASDVGIPYLAIVQKSGKVFDAHPEWLGKFVLNKELDLGHEIKGIPLRIKKTYEEEVEFGSETIPQKFATDIEARAAKVPYREVGEIDVLVCLPEGCEEYAQIGEWAPARFVVRKGSYRACVGTLLRDLAGYLKSDLSSGIYTWKSEKKTNKGMSYYVPAIKAFGKTPSDIRAEIKTTFCI